MEWAHMATYAEGFSPRHRIGSAAAGGWRRSADLYSLGPESLATLRRRTHRNRPHWRTLPAQGPERHGSQGRRLPRPISAGLLRLLKLPGHLPDCAATHDRGTR